MTSADLLTAGLPVALTAIGAAIVLVVLVPVLGLLVLIHFARAAAEAA